MSSGTGISGGGTLPDDRSVKHGIAYVNETTTTHFDWPNPVFAGMSQTASTTLTAEVHVYREPAGSDGTEVFVVAFIGDQLISPHAPPDNRIMSDIRLTGHDRDALDPGLGKGYTHYRTEVQISPSATGCTIGWNSTAPSTTNRESTIQDQVVYSYTTTEGVEGDGDGFKISAGASQNEQHWSSVTDQIHDWYVVEESDAGTNTAAWVYAQTRPWDGRGDDPVNFDSHWEQAYNMGGKWDDVKEPVELSKSTMQYHYIASWKFFRRASTDPLIVTLNGSSTHHFCAISMPECGNGIAFVDAMTEALSPSPEHEQKIRDEANIVGHHHAETRQMTLGWRKDIDLYALTKFK